MIRILVTDGMDRKAVAQLKEKGFEVVEKYFEPQELQEEIKAFDVLVVRSATQVDRPLIDAAQETRRLRLIVRAGVGLDNIDGDYAKSHGIEVMNTPNASSASVAELVLAHMFSLARFIGAANVSMRQGNWLKKDYVGVELAGKTLGLVGFGRNARETAKRAYALGMKVIYTELLGPVENYEYCDCLTLPELLAQADFISLHIPYQETPVIGKEEFQLMKDGIYLINCARGGLISEEALLQALDTGKVAGAALDVFEEEPTKNKVLVNHPRVSVTPHIGATTKEAQTRIGSEIVEIVSNFFA